ncbi:DNA-directed RNA polymerase I largest subunit [Trypanosoma brucei brucei TREU927]|uniref:DNA-directed RNA polymerase I subunit RPA1 n=1 Tax=Trypanosoma brucei brucei (strain 927/4 GUTat10.1) TaxID=185431 RepID=Q57UI1_TRYB2|nr:DNA-directed RNA polymerase I largest subunit [Trypanosoma brucei brucei TREU927]AAX70750.1 DNA-directed RNA polymerase I largest subunit [Trypanosoma brucei]AAZ13273.1 DNA-directed RNA polymerase I largest subunit [Trypanosoma brucei brucei TREU927]
MSLITDFPFHAYLGDLKTRRVMGAKDAVSLSLLASEDMSGIAFVEVRTRAGQEDRSAPWRPVVRNGENHATFYDTRMGNFDANPFPPQTCQTCAASLTGKYGNERCHGHFGFVGMPRIRPGSAHSDSDRLVVLNPHLAMDADRLFRAKCFFCHKFRAPTFDVERFRQALVLADHGLPGDALHLLDTVPTAKGHDAMLNHRRMANEEIVNDVSILQSYVDRILRQRASGCSEEDAKARVTMAQKGTVDVRNDICNMAISHLRSFSGPCSHCTAISPTFLKRGGIIFFLFRKSNLVTNIAKGFLTQQEVSEWEAVNRLHGRTGTYFDGRQMLFHMKNLFAKEQAILGLLYPNLGEPSVFTKTNKVVPASERYKLFFLDRILVPPLPLRLSSGVRVNDNGLIIPDEQTRALSDILGFVEQIECFHTLSANSTNGRSFITDAQRAVNESNLRNLQQKVDEFYAEIINSFAKKEGLFRMNMMGKRVNQACRSVISPDPFVEPNEVLLPRPLARALSFPEQVTCFAPARMNLLKHCVVNGPRKYPGATHIELRHANGEIRSVDLNVPEQTRRQHAARFFAMAQSGVTLIVYRHILNGDRVIFNRQPTLHKPSMMGYRVKVLSGSKTIRFHYVNGNSFNADFDGDEMNVHVPQSIETRAEVETLMDANINYLVPTSGRPIRGLIQDHVAAGVLVTLRDKFFDHSTFVQLVYNGVGPYIQENVGITLAELIPIPAILMPRPMWTGKQLISVMVRFSSGLSAASDCGREIEGGITLKGTSQIQPSAFDRIPAGSCDAVRVKSGAVVDSTVMFANSELITGFMCKKQLGASNMSAPHHVYELYGPHRTGQLFAAFGRVLLLALRKEGLSLAMDDMFLVDEERRCDLLRKLDDIALDVPDEEATAAPMIADYATKIQQEFVPQRMLVPFPKNHLLLMTISGAKGSNLNATQMSLQLGQQLFDGLRVKRMNSSKTLPSFFTNEKRARSFGFAMGSFASGIRPAEYTIHAMAGRDGLIDTAVKTSRSGHLQRCLIKGLESLVVHWDRTVRDSNGSVIQFMYGGDGLDPCKASTLTAWEMMKDNVVDVSKRFGGDASESVAGAEDGAAAGLEEMRNEDGKPTTEAVQNAHMEQQLSTYPLPASLDKSLSEYLCKKADFPLFRKVSTLARWDAKQQLKERLQQRRQKWVGAFEKTLADITARRRLWALCEPGEPVGLLAAQAAGEPSTQMTLNTFHTAGSTVSHVTEGIPRLRELLIYASVNKAAVVVPVTNATEEDEKVIAKMLRAGVAAKLTDCLAKVTDGAGGQSASSSMQRNLNTGFGKGYHYHVARGRTGMVITVSFLFSRSCLEELRKRMCMSPSEHRQSFTEALKNVVRLIMRSLSAVPREKESGDGSGNTGGMKGGSGRADRKRKRSGPDDGGGPLGGTFGDEIMRIEEGTDSDDGMSERSSIGGGRAGSEVSSLHSDGTDTRGIAGSDTGGPQRRRGSVESGRGDDASDSEAADPDLYARRSGSPARDAEDGDEMQDRDGTDWGGTSMQGVVGYDNFPEIHMSFTKSNFGAVIAPLSTAAAARDGVVQLHEDFFIVNAVLRTPSDVIAVIPDVVDNALEAQRMPSWLPQFGSLTFTRLKDKGSGQLVFQGPGSTMRNVMSFLSLFTVGIKSIKLHQACSTDIRDMGTYFGIESGYAALYDELNKLFNRYNVDPRHLSLIADTSTHRGRWENFNFTGVISTSASPLFQMTFASSKRWLHRAVSRGMSDDLESFSSAIMVGERPRVGTASVRLSTDTAILRDVLERNFA